MKFFSIKNFGKRFERAFSRFPLALIFAIICTLLIIFQIEDTFDAHSDSSWLLKYIAISGIAVPMFASIHLWAESLHNSRKKNIGYIIGFVFIAILVFTIPQDLSELYYKDNAKLAGYFISFHLLFSFIPFISKGSNKNFWQFNLSTFLSFLESALYSFILFLGITLALAAVENLFDVDLHDEIYVDLFVIIAVIFHTFYFLSEIKNDPYDESETIESHRIFGFFSKFILFPLTLIYFAILYAFSFKLLIQQDWSRGWISSLILGFSVTGILCYLFNYYLIKKENTFLSIFKKWFFPALLPMAVVLFLAVGLRISNYGITENRYIGILSAIWIALISIYFILSKKDNIKIIPISLFAFVMISILGPTNMSRIGIQSQMNRLGGIFESNKLITDNILTKNLGGLSEEDESQVSSIIQYLDNRKALDQLSKFQSESVPLFNEDDSLITTGVIAERLGLKNFNPYINRGTQPIMSYYPNKVETQNISEYQYVQNFNAFGGEIDNSRSNIFQIKFGKHKNSLILSGAEGFDTELDLSQELERIKSLNSERTSLSNIDCSLRLENDEAKALIVFDNLNFDYINGSYDVSNITGRIYIKIEDSIQ